MSKCVLLFSGGLDSTYLFLKLINKGIDVIPLLIKDENCPETENRAYKAYKHILSIAHKTSLHHLSYIRKSDYKIKFSTSHEVKGRNLILIGEAVKLAVERNADSIGIACYGDPSGYADQSSDFIVSLDKTLKRAGAGINWLYTLEIEKSKLGVLLSLHKGGYNVSQFVHNVGWCNDNKHLKDKCSCKSCVLMKEEWTAFLEKTRGRKNA